MFLIFFFALNTDVYQSSSGDTDLINYLFTAFLFVAFFIFLGVLISTIYIIIKFNHKMSETPVKSLEGNRNFEIGITATALLIVLIFSFASVSTMSKIDPLEARRDPDIIIKGHQWWWEISYPKENVHTANELHIPAGKRILAKVLSADVVHDWWVPALGRKIDLVPGQGNYVFIEAKQEGIYTGACSEFCGIQHAWMRIKVFAEDEVHFNSWLAHQKKEASNSITGISAKGKELFENKSCGGCHRIKGTKMNELIGPDLTHVASRSTLLSGKESYSMENLKKWIAHPQKEKPGAYMPDFILTTEEVNAIAEYLNELK
jgi:cytochrome c oxidase subunit II